jgi:hypothetical protein
MPIQFIHAGLRFFAGSLVAALLVIALAPLPAIRLLGAIALACATGGVLLHLYAMQTDDHQAFSALGHRLESMLAPAQNA